MKYETLKEDCYYHIYNRGNNKEDIFLEEINYFYFLKLVNKYILPLSDVIAYCLLKNHFHLLIKTHTNVESKRLSQSFSNLFNAYSKAINKSYNRTGSLFQDRFSRIKIENEDYLKSLIIYIHTNPVHHGFSKSFQDYKFSSFKAIVSNKPTSVSRRLVLNLFDDVENLIFCHNQKTENLENLILE